MNYQGTYGLDKPCAPGREHRWVRAGHLGPLVKRQPVWRCQICGVRTMIPPPAPKQLPKIHP